MSEPYNRFPEPLPEPVMKIDRPHEPWGPHVDIITPLQPVIPAAEKIRIGPTGDIISHDINIRKNWP